MIEIGNRLKELAKEVMSEVVGEDKVIADNTWSNGSTDMGDMSALWPVIHPYVSGAIGTGHGNDYYLKDLDTAIFRNAEFQTLLTIRLLENDGKRARKIIENRQVLFSNKDDYFSYVDGHYANKEVIDYQNNGKIVVAADG